MQQLVDFFNQATNMEVGRVTDPCNLNRINNLVANVRFSEVDFCDGNKIVLSFSTLKKGKAPQCKSYTIDRDRLTEEQTNKIIEYSREVKS